MEYTKIGLWAKGYLDALSNSDVITRSQLEYLISEIKKMISNIETSENKEPKNITTPEDDLPF